MSTGRSIDGQKGAHVRGRARRVLRACAGALAALALLTAACGVERVCDEVAVSGAAAAALPSADELGFRAQPPCGFDDALLVTRVFIDVMPGDPPHERINFIVERRGERAFLLSETRALIPFTQIPQGSEWLRLETGGVSAVGFAGPSGDGRDIAYLRWRVQGVTFELAATLHTWLSTDDLLEIARAHIDNAATLRAGS